MTQPELWCSRWCQCVVTQPKPRCSRWCQCVATQTKPRCSRWCQCLVTQPKLRCSRWCQCLVTAPRRGVLMQWFHWTTRASVPAVCVISSRLWRMSCYCIIYAHSLYHRSLLPLPRPTPHPRTPTAPTPLPTAPNLSWLTPQSPGTFGTVLCIMELPGTVCCTVEPSTKDDPDDRETIPLLRSPF